MAIIEKQYAKIGGVFVEEYMTSHIEAVNGLLSGGKIDRTLLPKADDLQLGAVKLSGEYDGAALGDDVAFLQSGAKTLYDALVSRIQNLESPLDYLGSMPTQSWSTSKTQAQINNDIGGWIINTHGPGVTPKPGATALIYNESSSPYMYSVGGHYEATSGYWLWIYDGTNWVPSVDFPDVPRANYSGTNQVDMVEGIITQEMLWKLKNIGAGANVTSVAGKTGVVTLSKTDVGLGNVDNTADSAKNVASAAKLTTARTIAGVSFDGTVNIAIPFANLSTKPTTLSGYGITDAQAKDADLTAIAALPDANVGLLKKTNVNTWTLDTTPYISGITKPMVEAVLTGQITSHSHIDASETAKGMIELATEAEALAGADTVRATSPARVKAMIDKFAALKRFATMPALADVEEGQFFLVQQAVV